MQALVLVGGEGTRLRPLTRTIPKPVVPLCGRPFVSYMIDWLARRGVTDVILASGFQADRLRDALGERDAGPKLRFVEESEPLGTAGAMKNAEDLLEDRFLALNGDVLTDLDLSALLAQHEETGARATLALYGVDDASAYGVVRRDDAGAVTEFLEKPSGHDAGAGQINAGAYVLERSVLDLVPADAECSIERDVFPKLVGDGLYARPLDGYWMDIGTPERYLQASWDILEGRVATGRDDLAAPLIAGSAEVAGDARIGPRGVIGERCRIEAGAEVDESVLLDDCVVGAGASVRGAILSPGTEVAAGATVAPGSVSAERELIETA